MGLSSGSTKDLIQLGADVEITDEAGYSSGSVKELIRAAVASGKHVTVHAGKFSSSSLKEMIKTGNGNVSIVI